MFTKILVLTKRSENMKICKTKILFLGKIVRADKSDNYNRPQGKRKYFKNFYYSQKGKKVEKNTLQ